MNSSKEKAEILKERAKALAKARVEGDDANLEVVAFKLAHERYALELTHIREVHPLKELTPLPGAPDFVLGIVNIRGRILSVIDIKRFFDLPEKGLTDLNQVIILQSDEMEFGILADEILGTSSIPASNIQASLPTLTGIRAEYLKGVTGDRLVILDADRLLSDEKILVK
ncbi:MAG: purine-binding chemotaxis protein CheW [Desulfosarcina sp.]|nr:purine-binding chemotaxis protein CheW [Desulfobacterales bacterium]